jgi:RHS repeat-associated protein
MSPSGVTVYVQDVAGRLIAEATDTGVPLREYIWLDDMPLAVFSDLDTTPQLYFVHPDHLDRPLRMTDSTQAVVWDAVYRPFGEVVSITGTATLNLRFPGQYFLIESGLAYNWHRHYDSTIGRYTQPDPLEFVNGPSRYAYAKSSPTMETDPEGLQASIARPRPGVPFPYPKPLDEWNRRGTQGMWDFLVRLCRRAISRGGRKDDDDDECDSRYRREVR